MSYAIVRNEKLTRDEAKGRYVLVYFVMLLPIAAAGCEGIMEFIRRRRKE